MRSRHTLFAAALLPALAACPGQFEGEPATLSGFDEPVALAAHPDMCTVYVANGNFDVRKRGGSVVAVDVATRAVLPGRGVEIGSFAGQVRIHPSGRLGYVSVRGDDSVTWFRIDDDTMGLYCDGGERSCGRLQARTRPGVSRSYLAEPLGLELVCARDELLRCEPGTVEGLLTTWLRDGEVTMHQIETERDAALGEPVDPSSAFHLTKRWRPDERFLVPGINGVAVLPGGRSGYISSFDEDSLTRFDIEEREREWLLEQTSQSRVVGATHDSRYTELRSIATNPAGDRLFIAGRNPTSRRGTAANLFVVDVRETTYGGVEHATTAVIPLEGRPGVVRYLPRAEGPDLLYIVLFSTDRLVVVDAERLEVVDVVDLQAGVALGDLSEAQGRSPFDLAFVVHDTPGGRCGSGLAEAPRMEAWVTEFGANRVAVVDIQPNSEDYHTVVEWIGGGDG